MGQCFLYGNGGGNPQYKVNNGTSAPASPKEGDIWVKTSVTITYVTFMSYTVATPEWSGDEGEICIFAGNIYSETTDANMDHRPNFDMNLYPRLCALYHNGGWSYVDAYVYNSNKQWGQFSFATYYLFNNGDQRTGITNGWEGNSNAEIGDTLKLKVANSRPIVSTANAIDLTGFTKLHCVADTAFGKFGVAGIKNVNASEPNWAASASIGTTDTVLDISSIQSGYIQCFAGASWSVTVNISKIWLE